ncbi:hypothetical protein HGQ85_00430 [Clostridioides difficile]|nr:hypothetical protein [Clostridioides difficile]
MENTGVLLPTRDNHIINLNTYETQIDISLWKAILACYNVIKNKFGVMS